MLNKWNEKKKKIYRMQTNLNKLFSEYQPTEKKAFREKRISEIKEMYEKEQKKKNC